MFRWFPSVLLLKLEANFLEMSEKHCLQWNDFQDNVKNAFGKLRDSTDFVDVTLACEDGHQVDAPKVILAGQVLFNWFIIFFMNIVIIQMNIDFEQLPNFSCLRFVSINYPGALMVLST